LQGEQPRSGCEYGLGEVKCLEQRRASTKTRPKLSV
jgi:hypothetical protein